MEKHFIWLVHHLTLESNSDITDLNEYNFYYGKAYTGVTGYGKVTMVFYKNNTADIYIDGNHNSTISTEYSVGTIDMPDMNVTATVNSDGTQISVPNMGATIALEEYSVVFGSKYIDINSGGMTFYYDGSIESSSGIKEDAGYVKYVVNEDRTTSILILKNEEYIDIGMYVSADGKTLYDAEGYVYTLESSNSASTANNDNVTY
jgi:hypothetical protein